jgi:hypothetical protein
MNCTTAQRLLDLYRPGERSEKETRALAEHIRICERCSREKERIEKAALLLKPLPSTNVRPPQPERLTRAILEGIRDADLPVRHGPLDRIIESFFHPVVRNASLAFVTTAIAVFSFQWVTLMNDLRHLEELQHQGHDGFITREYVYSVHASALPGVASLLHSEPLLDVVRWRQNDGIIQLRQSEVNFLLSSENARSFERAVETATLHIGPHQLDEIVHDIAVSLNTIPPADRQRRSR